MSQNASEKTPRICSQNNIAEASFSAWPLRFVKAPVNMDTMKIQSATQDLIIPSSYWSAKIVVILNPNLSHLLKSKNLLDFICVLSSRYSCLSSDWDAWMMMDPRHKMEDYHMENWWTKWCFPKFQLTTCKYKLLNSRSKPVYIQNTIFVMRSWNYLQVWN